MTVKTSVPRVYDFLKWYVEERFCFIAATIRNATGATIGIGALKPGQPLNLNGTQWETINSGSESGVDGFFIDSRKTPELANTAISTLEYRILVRGPAIVNVDAVPLDNQAVPVAYVEANLITRMAALDIQVLVESPTTAEQIY